MRKTTNILHVQSYIKSAVLTLLAACVLCGCDQFTALTNPAPSEDTQSQEQISQNDEQKDQEHNMKDESQATILRLFRKAIEPVGSTLYIWGGGWNEEDTGGGVESVTIGVSPEWKNFYDTQDEWYDYSYYPYEIHEGLDCSGYIGWLVYNTLETEDGKESYVTNSPYQTGLLEERGLGKVIPYDEIVDLLPGDIFNSDDHIYMLIRAFEDGSRLIVHASPPGVQFSGTPDYDGNPDSEAAYWASQIMANYFPDYYSRYPNVYVDGSYYYFDQFRFDDKVISGAAKADEVKIEELINLIMAKPDNSEEKTESQSGDNPSSDSSASESVDSSGTSSHTHSDTDSSGESHSTPTNDAADVSESAEIQITPEADQTVPMENSAEDVQE